MFDQASIYNGAKCKSYSWSQSHSDLEIRIKIDKSIRQDDIQVEVSKTSINVEVVPNSVAKYEQCAAYETLMEGKFEHTIDTNSCYWLIESENSHNNIAIFVDKVEEMWWKKLLVNEVVVESGARNYTVAMDQLDGSSRMVIERLIKDQQQKKLDGTSNNFDSPA